MFLLAFHWGVPLQPRHREVDTSREADQRKQESEFWGAEAAGVCGAGCGEETSEQSKDFRNLQCPAPRPLHNTNT